MMKEKSSSRRTLQWILTLFNVIFWFAGLGVLGLGIWLYITIADFRAAIEYAQYTVPAFLLMISGGVIVILGILGCIAIFTGNRCLLTFYWFCIMLVCATDVAACIKSFFLYNEVESHVSYRLNITLVYKYMYEEDFTRDLDKLQQNFECCGIRNASDWYQTYYNQRAKSLVSQGLQPYPVSCCRDTHNCSLNLASESPHIYAQGCMPIVVERLRLILGLAGWSTLAFCSMMIIMSFMVCCLRLAVH